MIELKIKDYCQDCTEFDVDIDEYLRIDGCAKHTLIRCKHEKKCLSIKTHLETTLGKQQNDD